MDSNEMNYSDRLMHNTITLKVASLNRRYTDREDFWEIKDWFCEKELNTADVVHSEVLNIIWLNMN